MRKLQPAQVLLAAVVLYFVIGLALLPGTTVMAQEGPAATETVVEPTTPAPTATFTSTPVPTATRAPGPVPIPEPITVILFGTGLAALSAAAARRHRKQDSE